MCSELSSEQKVHYMMSCMNVLEIKDLWYSGADGCQIKIIDVYSVRVYSSLQLQVHVCTDSSLWSAITYKAHSEILSAPPGAPPHTQKTKQNKKTKHIFSFANIAHVLIQKKKKKNHAHKNHAHVGLFLKYA